MRVPPCGAKEHSFQHKSGLRLQDRQRSLIFKTYIGLLIQITASKKSTSVGVNFTYLGALHTIKNQVYLQDMPLLSSGGMRIW